jgi:hypothetical protein
MSRTIPSSSITVYGFSLSLVLVSFLYNKELNILLKGEDIEIFYLIVFISGPSHLSYLGLKLRSIKCDKIV